MDNIFIITNTKLYVPFLTLSVKDNQKLLDSLAKDSTDHFIGMNIKQGVKIKIHEIDLDIFLI